MGKCGFSWSWACLMKTHMGPTTVLPFGAPMNVFCGQAQSWACLQKTHTDPLWISPCRVHNSFALLLPHEGFLQATHCGLVHRKPTWVHLRFSPRGAQSRFTPLGPYVAFLCACLQWNAYKKNPTWAPLRYEGLTWATSHSLQYLWHVVNMCTNKYVDTLHHTSICLSVYLLIDFPCQYDH